MLVLPARRPQEAFLEMVGVLISSEKIFARSGCGSCRVLLLCCAAGGCGGCRGVRVGGVSVGGRFCWRGLAWQGARAPDAWRRH